MDKKPATPSNEAIYRAIYSAIVEHHLPPGTKLSEDALAEVFRVSRTRINRVLQRLGHENIVVLHRNRGAFVAQPSVEEAHDIFAARRLIEAGIVAGIAGAASPAQVAELGRFVVDERAAQERREQRSMIKLSGEFHLKLAALYGNRTLLEVLRELISRTSLIIAVYAAPGAAPCNCSDHEALVAQIAEGDVAGAAAAMTRHLTGIESSLALEVPPREPIDLHEIFARAAVLPAP